jgi:hypothetical protein
VSPASAKLKPTWNRCGPRCNFFGKSAYGVCTEYPVCTKSGVRSAEYFVLASVWSVWAWYKYVVIGEDNWLSTLNATLNDDAHYNSSDTEGGWK